MDWVKYVDVYKNIQFYPHFIYYYLFIFFAEQKYGLFKTFLIKTCIKMEKFRIKINVFKINFMILYKKEKIKKCMHQEINYKHNI